MVEITGESVTIIRKGYTVQYIKPCTMERGKKMAKVRLPPFTLTDLKKGTFDNLKIHPELGMAQLSYHGMAIMIFATGEVSIRTAISQQAVLEAADYLARLLKS